MDIEHVADDVSKNFDEHEFSIHAMTNEFAKDYVIDCLVENAEKAEKGANELVHLCATTEKKEGNCRTCHENLTKRMKTMIPEDGFDGDNILPKYCKPMLYESYKENVTLCLCGHEISNVAYMAIYSPKHNGNVIHVKIGIECIKRFGAKQLVDNTKDVIAAKDGKYRCEVCKGDRRTERFVEIPYLNKKVYRHEKCEKQALKLYGYYKNKNYILLETAINKAVNELQKIYKRSEISVVGKRISIIYSGKCLIDQVTIHNNAEATLEFKEIALNPTVCCKAHEKTLRKWK